jgi:hypothetical protein
MNNSAEITNSSALQLYHAAYRFHYETNDLKEACRLYREIIRHFPDSNESAYAVVQLEKIGAQEALKMLQNNAWQKVIPFIALLISIFALLIATAALLLILNQKETLLFINVTPDYYTLYNEKIIYYSVGELLRTYITKV